MPTRPKILVIDDECDIVRSLSVRLSASGYDVLTAVNGAVGLAMALRSVPDGILLDIRMPGMDGFEVLGQLKQHPETKAIPVIAVSANVVEQVRSQALASGACRFVGKPFQASKLLSAVRDVIGVRSDNHLDHPAGAASLTESFLRSSFVS